MGSEETEWSTDLKNKEKTTDTSTQIQQIFPTLNLRKIPQQNFI